MAELKSRLENEHRTDLSGRYFTRDIEGQQVLRDGQTVGEANLKQGDMIYILVDESKTGVHEMAHSSAKKITKDGDIVAQDYASLAAQTGFRPGMLPLRSLKKQWTLAEYVSLDEQFVFRLKASGPSFCRLANTDRSAMEDFFGYARSFDFSRMRVGHLYGSFDEAKKSVNVDFIYEPPQETSDISFQLLEDPLRERVDALARLLGKQCVGWIFAHPPREEGFFFSCHEVLTAAELQLDAAQGVNDTLFVTIKATLDKEGQPLVDAWQVSSQGLEMVAEGALEVSPNLGHSCVNATFTAYVEGRPVKEIDNNFFITRVGIGAYESDMVNTFPRFNRAIEPTQGDLKSQVSRAGKEGWSLKALLLDFQLLLYLSQFLDFEQDMPRICSALIHAEQSIDEGYLLMIHSMADLTI